MMGVGVRVAFIWVALFGTAQFTDVLTTAVDRARGGIEVMPMSEAVMEAGGMPLFALLKFCLVVAAAAMVALFWRWSRFGRPGSRTPYALVLSAVRVTTVAITIVSLHNALLLTSL